MRTNFFLLRKLAHLYGVQTAYYDVHHRPRQASPEALILALRALGAPVETLQDVPTALRERRQALWRRPLPPVLVAWNDRPLQLDLRLPVGEAGDPMRVQVQLETGETLRWDDVRGRILTQQTVDVEGVRYATVRLAIPQSLPLGYHRLTAERAGRQEETLVISAPAHAYGPEENLERTWGVFLPLYALHSQRSWGAGDLTDLEALMEWTAELGGGVTATLPLLATFFHEPLNPSPYIPVSHLFWNEFYIDLTRAPELQKCPSARALLDSTGIQREVEALRASALVQYQRQMELKRRILAEMAGCFFSGNPERNPAFQRFLKEHPDAEDYARFRAACERLGSLWPAWPQRLRDGVLKEGDYDEETRRYYLYSQWLIREQIRELSERARQKGQQLYLDLPLGVHPHGYDVWRERSLFATDISVGAPPDAFFTKGQDWAFPPLHPERIREQGYRYFIRCLRHHLKHAGWLRMDHVMGLHRLFWIPHGLEPREGVYVRYPAEELYAILTLESHRHRAVIVGENLGTVPSYVNAAMRRHRIQQMYVLQYEVAPDARRPLRLVPANTVASLNTHDMPTFAAFWKGNDVRDRQEMGLLTGPAANKELRQRKALKNALVRFLKRQRLLKMPATTRSVLKACLAYLGASPARLVVVNLEDLWLETHPQNVPGTGQERPNWRRKARYSFEKFSQTPQVRETLVEIGSLRKGGEPSPSGRNQ